MLLPLSVPVTSVFPDPEITIVPDSLLPDCCQVSVNVPLTEDGAEAWYCPDQVPESDPEVAGGVGALVDWLAEGGGEVEPLLLQAVVARSRTTKHPIVPRQPPTFRPAGVTDAAERETSGRNTVGCYHGLERVGAVGTQVPNSHTETSHRLLAGLAAYENAVGVQTRGRGFKGSNRSACDVAFRPLHAHTAYSGAQELEILVLRHQLRILGGKAGTGGRARQRLGDGDVHRHRWIHGEGDRAR